MPTLIKIVQQYLKKGGYDGLFNAGECACEVDNLFPCEAPADDCKPGHFAPCPKTCGEHDWHIQARKPKTKGPK